MLTQLLVALALAGTQAAGQAAAPPQAEAGGRLTLDEAVSEALRRNPDLLVEREQVSLADTRRTTAGLRPNPLLSTSLDHLDLAGTGFSEQNGGGPAELSLRADMDWLQGGKRRRRLDVADRERELARLQVADRTRRLAFEVRSAFVDLLLAQRTARLTEENLASFAKVTDISAARVASGDLAEVELMRTRVALRQLENAAQQAVLERRLAQSRLRQLLGRPASAGLEALGEFAAPPGSALPGAEDLVQQALARRPDLQAAIADEQRSRAELRLQQALARPDYSVGAEYRRQQGVNGKSNSLGFFISTPLPFFDRNQGEVARAAVEARQSGLRMEAARAAVRAEVEEAWQQHRTAVALLQRIERDMLGDARDVRAITEYAYHRGEASLVELLDAQRAFNDTMESHIGAQAGVARSLYFLDAVCGKAD